MIVDVDSQYFADLSEVQLVVESDRKRLRFVESPNGDRFLRENKDFRIMCVHWSISGYHQTVLLTFHRGQRRVAEDPFSEWTAVQLLQYSAR